MIGYDDELAQAWLETHSLLAGGILQRIPLKLRPVLGGGQLVCQIGTGLPLRYVYPNPALEGMEATRQFFVKVRAAGSVEEFRGAAGQGLKEDDMPGDDRELKPIDTPDPWKNRAANMRCRTCMFYVRKAAVFLGSDPKIELGRCRRHAPTMAGFPATFPADWCGDHKLDETKLGGA